MNRIISMYYNERNGVEIDYEIDTDTSVEVHSTYSGTQYVRLTVNKDDAIKMLAALANLVSDDTTGRWLPPYK